MKKFENNSDVTKMEEWRYRQSIFIEDKFNNSLVDDIFFYENFEKTCLNICKKLKINENILHKNNMKNKNVNLTKAEIKWIKKNLSSDFIKYGYNL